MYHAFSTASPALYTVHSSYNWNLMQFLNRCMNMKLIKLGLLEFWWVLFTYLGRGYLLNYKLAESFTFKNFSSGQWRLLSTAVLWQQKAVVGWWYWAVYALRFISLLKLNGISYDRGTRRDFCSLTISTIEGLVSAKQRGCKFSEESFWELLVEHPKCWGSYQLILYSVLILWRC